MVSIRITIPTAAVCLPPQPCSPSSSFLFAPYFVVNGSCKRPRLICFLLRLESITRPESERSSTCDRIIKIPPRLGSRESKFGIPTTTQPVVTPFIFSLLTPYILALLELDIYIVLDCILIFLSLYSATTSRLLIIDRIAP